MNQYETIVIIDPNVEEENVEKITGEIKNLISGSDGEVTKVEVWGKRRLAYEVKGNRDGIYILINFTADPEFIQRLARYYGLTEQIIKYMTVRAEDLPEPVGTIRRPVRRNDDEEDDDDTIDEDVDIKNDDRNDSVMDDDDEDE